MAISFHPSKNVLDTKKKLLLAAELALGLFLFIIPGGPVRPIVEDGPDPEEVANFHLNGWPEVSSWYTPLGFFVDEQVASEGVDDAEHPTDAEVPEVLEEKEEDSESEGKDSEDESQENPPLDDSSDEVGKDDDKNDDSSEDPSETPSEESPVPPAEAENNTAPVAQNQTVSLQEGSSVIIQLAASDADGDPLTFAISLAPANGTLTGISAHDGIVTYMASGSFSGNDYFEFMAVDTSGLSDYGRVNLVIMELNGTSSVGSNHSETNANYTLIEDQPLQIPASNNSTETIHNVTQPAHGTITQHPNGTITYTPEPNYSGTDSFVINSGNGGSTTTQNVTVSVISVNDAPVASNVTLVTEEDTPVVLAPVNTISDVDGDVNSLIITHHPVNGTLIIDSENLTATYVPNPNFHGTDSFGYTISDGTYNSSGTVAITIIDVNDPPVVSDGVLDSISTNQSTPVRIDIIGSLTDPDGDVLNIDNVTQPSNGTVILHANGTVTYIPDPGFVGQDIFEFTVTDGNGGSIIGVITVTVEPVATSSTEDDSVPDGGNPPGQNGTDSEIPNSPNHPPISASVTHVVDEDGSISIQLQASDEDGDLIYYTVVTPPLHGTVTINSTSGVAHYTPFPNYFGPDSFTFNVDDGSASSGVAAVAITVNAVNDAPVALDYAIYTNEGASTLVQILSGVIDVDGDVLTISITAFPLHGGVVVNANGSLTYSPDPDFFGTDSFEYTISDANGGLSSAVISITLGSVNDAPVSTSASATVQEDAPAEIELHTSDADDDVLTMVIVSPPAHGTLEIISTDGFVVLYTPAENYNGTDSFSYQVTDGLSYSEVATVSIVVVGANDLPVATDDEAKTKKKKTVQIGVLENDIDPDSVLYVQSVGEPGHGSVQIGPDGKTLIYTPNGWFLGTDSFTYTISDGVYSSTATVEVTVYAKNGGDGDDDDDGDDDSNGEDDDNGNGDDDGDDNTDDGEGDGSGGGDGDDGDGNEGDDGNDETNEENEGGQSPTGDCVEEEEHDFGFEAECEDADKGRGFTAGAGWITLSEDAQILDDEAEENVVFGFIGKYLKNDPDPRGITLLHIHSADFTFFSMSHDSLVVDGAKAQFGGTGRVNGDSGYSFMITIIDDRLSDEVDDDTLRIKIWNTLSGVVVVDSMPGAPDDADPTSEVSGFVFILKK